MGEELKIILESLSKMGDGAQYAFIAWCVKEVIIYLMGPISLCIVGFSIYKIANSLQKRWLEYTHKAE